MVSIPIWFDLKLISSVVDLLVHGGFNSYMVRFKASGNFTASLASSSFNSYMVRFKVCRAFADKNGSAVSIPIWFDLKTANDGTIYYDSTFQFLYGSI